MKVRNMTNNEGRAIPNQFIIEGHEENGGLNSHPKDSVRIFQSYDSTIVRIVSGKVYLDVNTWDYSVTTGRYRNQFLGEKKAETQKKIDSGEYTLADLN